MSTKKDEEKHKQLKTVSTLATKLPWIAVAIYVLFMIVVIAKTWYEKHH
jgi:Na+/citrate or Na+/malate symporter